MQRKCAFSVNRCDSVVLSGILLINIFFFCITSSSFLIINSSCRSTSFFFSQMPHVPSGNAQLANQRLEPDIGIFSVFRRQRRIPVLPKGKRSTQEPEQLF